MRRVTDMTMRQARARVFGEVAEEYDRIRPDYPEELVDDVLAYAGLGEVRALEVGAGTGKSTLAFAKRGIGITAIEPDEAMAAVLTRHVLAHPKVSVTISSFEKYVPSEPFGLVFSAQAWHWTDPAVRWQKAAAALAPGGALALFWNNDQPSDPDVTASIIEVQRKWAPEIATDAFPTAEPMTGGEVAESWPRTDLVTLPEFGELEERLYHRERSLSSVDYTAYLSTQSAYRMLDAAVRAQLFDAIIERVGPQIDFRVQTVLYMARRLPHSRRT